MLVNLICVHLITVAWRKGNGDFKTFKVFINKIALFYRKMTLFSFQKDWRKQHQLFPLSLWKDLWLLFSLCFKALCLSGFTPHRCFPCLTQFPDQSPRQRSWSPRVLSRRTKPTKCSPEQPKNPRTSKWFSKLCPFLSKALEAAATPWQMASRHN